MDYRSRVIQGNWKRCLIAIRLEGKEGWGGVRSMRRSIKEVWVWKDYTGGSNIGGMGMGGSRMRGGT